MNVFSRARDVNPGPRRISAAIGVFDGVHLGHQQVIRRALADAHQMEGMSLVVTFDRHPNSIVAPDRTPPMIHTSRQKLRALESFGVEATLMLPFDLAFSRQEGREFISRLAEDLAPLSNLCVGSEFAFGKGRSGTVGLLQEMGKELGFSVHGLAAVSLDGEVVSSTRIRQAIQSGRLDEADQMLGRSWELSGEVQRGRQAGRTLGFPTANLGVTGLVLPPIGVYAAHARVNTQVYRAVVNIGRRPTLGKPESEIEVEAHLLQFSEEIYGQEIDLQFISRLREERKFPSMEALRFQIQQDIHQAQALFP